MKNKFPDISDSQVVLMRSEYSTGIVLDENYNRALHHNQIVYTVFESIEAAREYAKNTIDEEKDLEITIYGKEYTGLEYITP